ncbi:MAG: BlaI/MecI/CopY family transcriptional regulator [Clostridia bacterium]|nr:BlaI/MecI/CopY family transcriptional regulator [Clostridia bacterium]
MKDKYDITDSELEIMQVLWNNGNCGLAEIVAELDKTKKRNKNTVKTLLYRLVDKGAVKSQKVNGQEFSYVPTITEKKYLSKANDSFLSKLYKGNVEKLLLNFVEDKTVSKEELQKLVNMLESED